MLIHLKQTIRVEGYTYRRPIETPESSTFELTPSDVISVFKSATIGVSAGELEIGNKEHLTGAIRGGSRR